jgi:hypothetical protein
MSRTLRWALGLLLIAGLLIGAFFYLPFSPWMPGGTVGNVPNREVVNGTALNRHFPQPGPGQQIVFTQEKRGFSQARLKQGNEVRALLSISDVTTTPVSRAKFNGIETLLKGWPLVDQGAQASALLVADRFQVKVIAQGIGMDAGQRHELLEDFDLQGLASLEPASRKGSLKPARDTATAPQALPPGRKQPLRFPFPARQRQIASSVSSALEPAT